MLEEVVEVQQPQLGVLAALQAKVRDVAPGGRGKDGGRRAPEVQVDRVQVLELGRRVGVDRIAARPRAVRVEGENGVPPVMPTGIAVEVAVAGHHEQLVDIRVVDHRAARPDSVLHVAHAVGGGVLDEMDGLVGAGGVPHLLRAGREIDRRDMPLVVAGIARIAAVRDIEIGRARADGRDRERWGALLDVGLERRHLRPAAGRDRSTIAAHRVLVHLAIEPIGVDELPIGIDRRRGGRVPRGGRRLMRPDARPGRGVQSHDVAGLGGQEEKILHPRLGRDVREERRSAIRDRGQGGAIDRVQGGDVAGMDQRLLGARTAVPGIEVELRPVSDRAGGEGGGQGEGEEGDGCRFKHSTMVIRMKDKGKPVPPSSGRTTSTTLRAHRGVR